MEEYMRKPPWLDAREPSLLKPHRCVVKVLNRLGACMEKVAFVDAFEAYRYALREKSERPGLAYIIVLYAMRGSVETGRLYRA